jgi:hypothetical protein
VYEHYMENVWPDQTLEERNAARWRKLQDKVRQYDQGEGSVVEHLLAERRVEAQRE